MKREKKFWSISILVIMIMMLSQSIVYAGTAREKEAQEISNLQSFSNGTTSRVIGQPRGQLLSSFEVGITDYGKGTVGLFGNVLCHQPVAEIRMNLYLEVWNKEESMWRNVKTYEYVWVASEMKEDLTAGIASFKVSGLERGRDYRVKGLAAVKGLNSSLHESWNANSGGIQVQSLD